MADPRRSALIAAQERALCLFTAIENKGLVCPGRREREVERDIGALAQKDFGVEAHWHKRVVRAGPNALTIASDNPPDRVIGSDDIVYVDLGPVFEAWEADVGRSYAFGPNQRKHALVSDLPLIFAQVQSSYLENPDMTGAELYVRAQHCASERGWTFGGKIAGHIVSEFAHANIPGDKTLNRISPANDQPMSNSDGLGRPRHWILEIHLVDLDANFGGFYEQLL